MGAFGDWMCLIFVHRKGEILGELGEFHAFKEFQLARRRFSYQWAWSPGCLRFAHVLPEASRLNCGTPSGEGFDLPICTILGCLG